MKSTCTNETQDPQYLELKSWWEWPLESLQCVPINHHAMILPQTYQNIPFMHACILWNQQVDWSILEVCVTVPSPSPECHSRRSQHWRVTNVLSSSPFGDRKPAANHWFQRWHTLILLQIDKPFRIFKLRCQLASYCMSTIDIYNIKYIIYSNLVGILLGYNVFVWHFVKLSGDPTQDLSIVQSLGFLRFNSHQAKPKSGR